MLWWQQPLTVARWCEEEREEKKVALLYTCFGWGPTGWMVKKRERCILKIKHEDMPEGGCGALPQQLEGGLQTCVR